MTTINRPIRVGRKDDNSAFLVADQDDLEAGEMNGPARIEYANGFVGDVMPLQQFYKFGVWLPHDDAVRYISYGENDDNNEGQ